jgi:signal transduction histidine kinase
MSSVRIGGKESASASKAASELPNVLLVDAQPARLLTYESVLAGVGVNCIRALSGDEALARLQHHAFAAILLDVSIPRMNGFETARRIREIHGFERTPIIFVTGGHLTELDRLQGYEAGVIDHIPVPIVPEILRSKIALLVELDRRHAELEALNRELETVRAQLELKSHEAMQTDLDIMRLLRDLAARTVAENDVQTLFDDILAAAVQIAHADAGSLQLLDDSTQRLYFVSRRGLDPDLTRHFECVSAGSGSPCGLALAAGTRAYVDFDVPESEDPDGSSRLHFEFGLRSAQSTPLLSRSGRALGMFSTHWRTRQRLTDREWRYLDLLARQAADLIERMQVEKSLRASELQLREADKRKDEFIAMLAHELRNPLVPIRTGVELLKRAREQPSLIETIRPMVERQIVHMVRLIDDLLDVSRITSGKIELRRQEASLSSLVGSSIEANRDAIAAAKLELGVSLSDPHITLEVDPTRFSQILSNLLQNAAKFTPPGGRVSVVSGVERDAASGKSELVIRVVDTGVGIPQSSIGRIFELFAQAGNAGQPSQPGLGIGLTLARRLAELHGGSLEARSEGVNKGSEFILRVPAPDAPQPGRSDAEHAPASLSGIAVVLIDDNRDGADIMSFLLQDFGATVDVAYDGLSGLETVRRVRPAVVLLDIGMPEIDGYEVCRRLRREFGERLGIIALTGWGQDQDRRLAQEAGFDAHLTKPADPGVLAATIVSTLLRPPGP